MKVNFSNINMDEPPILILEKADDTPIGVLGYATNIEFDPKYNELSVLTFNLPAMVDGEKTPYYDDVTGNKNIEIRGIGRFTIVDPGESGDKVHLQKSVTANSLEKEFDRKTLTLPEATYKFYDNTNTDGTLLGMIMELMPNWTIGSVDSEIVNKYRTFEISGENLYNFIKGTVQKNVPEDVRACAETIAERSRSELVTVIGRKFILYKPFREKPVIVLPVKK